MKSDLIQKMQAGFDGLAQTHPSEPGLEFWFARDLQEPLGMPAGRAFKGLLTERFCHVNQQVTTLATIFGA